LLAGRALEDNREEDQFYEGSAGVDQAKNEGHNIMVNAALARALGYGSPPASSQQVFIAGKSHTRVVGVVANTLSEGARAQGRCRRPTSITSAISAMSWSVSRPAHMPEARTRSPVSIAASCPASFCGACC